VISMEDWVTIQTLKRKNPSLSNRGLGKLLRVSHNTIKRALEKEAPPEYERKEKLSDKLAPFKEVIFKMVNINKYKGSRILEEIESKGYTGSKSTFYYHYQKIRQTPQKHYKPYGTSP